MIIAPNITDHMKSSTVDCQVLSTNSAYTCTAMYRTDCSYRGAYVLSLPTGFPDQISELWNTGPKISPMNSWNVSFPFGFLVLNSQFSQRRWGKQR